MCIYHIPEPEFHARCQLPVSALPAIATILGSRTAGRICKIYFLNQSILTILYIFLWAFQWYTFRAGSHRRTNLYHKSSLPVCALIDRAIRLNRLLTATRYVPGSCRSIYSGNRYPSKESSTSPARIHGGLEKLAPQNLPEVAMPLIG